MDYYASSEANFACKEAIESAIAKHYYNNTLHHGAVKEVVDQFGYERMFCVLANTVLQKEWDGRISDDNKRWAKTVTAIENPDARGDDRNSRFVVDRSHSGLTDLFIKQARREYLLTKPLTEQDIYMEASRIMSRLQGAQEPNSPNGKHFMAQISPDFLIRAKTQDQDKLFTLLPFASLTLSTLKDRKGEFVFISKDENRSQMLRQRKPSVKNKLRAEAKATGASKPKKKMEAER